MARLRLEVIAASLEDAVEAARGGAHRLEVVRDPDRGGLTPAIDLVREIQAAVRLPLRVMLRESDGFACRPERRETLVEAAVALDGLGIDGVVVGWIRDRRIDEETLGRVLQAAPSLCATFHRAFDTLPDAQHALAVLERYPQIDRVLTAAGAGPWTSRCTILADYVRWASPRIVILPGGDVDESALHTLADCAGISEAHVGRAARIGGRMDRPVSAELVKGLRRAAGW